jgi:SPP1 gp7 family putative phage head morphogenesis protein
MAKGKITEFQPSFIQRLVSGVKYTVSGNQEEFFGPSQPMEPAAQEAAVGRQFDYPVGFNLRQTPRESELNSFQQLRGLADSYDLLRIIIETRKDQVSSLSWTVKPRDKKSKADKRCEELNAFFLFPDREHTWDEWLRALLEDLFVIDAPTIYPRMNRGGGLYSLELMDGATIKRVIDDTGRTPIAPDPAYQQILKGLPAVNYSVDELVYAPRNIRTNKIYGYSPVEQIVMTVNIALRRQLHQLQYYTEGNVPEALVGVPMEWSPDQVAQFQMYWDNLMEGDTAARRHMRFVPGGLSIMNTKEAVLKDMYDEWLARVCCYAFSVDPNQLVSQVNRATAESVRSAALSEGLLPIMQWTRNMINKIIWKYFGYTDLEFCWEETETLDPSVEAKINQIYVSAGIKTVNEVRGDLGLDPIEGGDGQEESDGEDTAGGKDGKKEEKKAPDNKESEKMAKGSKKKSVKPRNKKVLARAEKTAIGITTEWLGKLKMAAIRHLNATSKAEKSSIFDSMDFDFDAFVAELTDVARVVAIDSAMQAVNQIEFAAEVAPAAARALAIAAAESRGAQLVTMISNSTRQMLAQSVADGMDRGLSTGELADELKDNYAFSDARAETIARTEMAFADVSASEAVYREAGADKKKWLLADEEYCDICALNAAAGAIPFDDPFPSGEMMPPEHPNCRCDLIPVFDSKED